MIGSSLLGDALFGGIALMGIEDISQACKTEIEFLVGSSSVGIILGGICGIGINEMIKEKYKKLETIV